MEISSGVLSGTVLGLKLFGMFIYIEERVNRELAEFANIKLAQVKAEEWLKNEELQEDLSDSKWAIN